jgi:hypothetical protein
MPRAVDENDGRSTLCISRHSITRYLSAASAQDAAPLRKAPRSGVPCQGSSRGLASLMAASPRGRRVHLGSYERCAEGPCTARARRTARRVYEISSNATDAAVNARPAALTFVEAPNSDTTGPATHLV